MKILKNISSLFVWDIVSVLSVIVGALSNYLINFKVASYTYHVAAIFDPVYKLNAGGTLGVDFESLYGFYPYILLPIHNLIFKQLNPESFILMLVVILGIGNIFLYIGLKKLFNNNKVLSLIVLCAIMFFCQNYVLVENMFPYFQYVSLRTIFPSICTMLCIYSFSGKENYKKYYNLVIIISAVALFWNIETGLFCFLSFFATILVKLANDYKLNTKEFWLNAMKPIMWFLVWLGTILFVLEVFAFTRSGQFFNPDKVIWGATVFTGNDYYMLPLPENSPYIIIVLLYSVCLIFNITKIENFGGKGLNNEDLLSVYFSILGLGLMSYFMGRSSIYNLLYIVWPFFILLGIWFLKFRNYYKNNNDIISNILARGGAFVSIGILLTYSISFFSTQKIHRYRVYLSTKAEGYEPALDYIFPKSVLEEFPDRKVTVLSPISSIISSDLNVVDAFSGQGYINWFLIEFLDQYRDFLIDDFDGIIIISNDMYNRLDEYSIREIASATDIIKFLDDECEFEGEDESLRIYRVFD